MSLQLDQGWEVQTALHTNVLSATLMHRLMCFQLTGIGKTSATDLAVVRLDVTVLHHVSLKVTGLSESLVAHLALMWPSALVCQHMRMQVAQLLEKFATSGASMWFNATVPQDMGDQIVLGCIGLLTHGTLPAFLFSPHINIVAVVYLKADIYSFYFLFIFTISSYFSPPEGWLWRPFHLKRVPEMKVWGNNKRKH